MRERTHNRTKDEEDGGSQSREEDDEANKGKKKKSVSLQTVLKYTIVSFVSILIGIGFGFEEFDFIFQLREQSFQWYLRYRWTKPAREFPTIVEGLAKSPTQPFIVRNAPELSYLNLEFALSEMKKHPEWVTAGPNNEGAQETREMSRLIEDFQSDTLDMFVFDSPLEMFQLPTAMISSHVPSKSESEDPDYILLQQGPVLSKKDAISPWHIDPTSKAGGWMYLWQGKKDWKFCDPWMTPYFYTSSPAFPYHIIDFNEADYDSVLSLPSSKEAFQVYKEYKGDLTYKPFQTTTARAGDFIYFPPGWLHRVETRDKALGLGE
jgi:hypothetical protein